MFLLRIFLYNQIIKKKVILWLLPKNIHKLLLPGYSFLVISSFDCISEVFFLFFIYFSQVRCLLCQGSYFLYIFLCLIFNIFYLFSIKKNFKLKKKEEEEVLIHLFIYELENELETYTLHQHVYIYKVCSFKKKKLKYLVYSK